MEENGARRANAARKIGWLFWLALAAQVVGLFANENIDRVLHGALIFAQIVSALIMALYGVVLLRLEKEAAEYRVAGIACIVVAALDLLFDLCSGSWLVIANIVGAIVGIFAEYTEYSAHAVLIGADNPALASKWRALWKWFLAAYLVLTLSSLLMLMPFIGIAALVVGGIAMIVVFIIKLVYLHMTAATLRG